MVVARTEDLTMKLLLKIVRLKVGRTSTVIWETMLVAKMEDLTLKLLLKKRRKNIT
jgi:hypothetical protein